MVKQICIYDKQNQTHIAGLQLENKDIITCDNGELIRYEDICKYNLQIVEEFKDWIDLTETILGDWI